MVASPISLAFYLIDASLLMTARSNIDVISMTLPEKDRVRRATSPFRDHHEPSFAAACIMKHVCNYFITSRGSEKTPVRKQQRRHAATMSCATRMHGSRSHQALVYTTWLVGLSRSQA